MTTRAHHRATINGGPTPSQCEKAIKDYESYPDPTNMADVVCLFGKIKTLYPNCLLHCSQFGTTQKHGFSLVSAMPIDVEREATRLGVDTESPEYAMARHGSKKDIADKQDVVLQMLAAQMIYVCQDQGLDPVKVSKGIWKSCQQMRAQTGWI